MCFAKTARQLRDDYPFTIVDTKKDNSIQGILPVDDSIDRFTRNRDSLLVEEAI